MEPNYEHREKCINALLHAITELKVEKGKLGKYPTSQSISVAQRAISEYDHETIEQLEDILHMKCPYGLDRKQFEKIRKLKEERCIKDSEIRKRAHLEVLELAERHHHYEEIISILEKELVALKNGNHDFYAQISSKTESFNSVDYNNRDSELKDYIEKRRKEAEAKEHERLQSSSMETIKEDNIEEKKIQVPEISALPKTTSYSSPSSPLSPLPPTREFDYLGRESAMSKIKKIQEKDLKNDKEIKPWNSLTAADAATILAPPKASAVARKITASEEGNSGVSINPQLLKLIEDTATEKREYFDISRSFGNSISFVPDSIGLLDSLCVLNLSENRLLFLPDSIGQLVNLTKLDIHSNQLIDIPDSIGQLANLKFFDAHHNFIEELPSSLGKCKNLEHLDVSFNSLKGISEHLCEFPKLKKLYLHLNQLKRLPKNMGALYSLEELDAHFNNLEGLPESIGKIHSLKSLNISGNHYDLKELPKSIGNLINLQILDISENHIRILPESFANLTSLKKLNMSNNPLKIPPNKVADQGLQAVMEYMSKIKEDYDKRGRKKLHLGSLFGGKTEKTYSHTF